VCITLTDFEGQQEGVRYVLNCNVLHMYLYKVVLPVLTHLSKAIQIKPPSQRAYKFITFNTHFYSHVETGIKCS